MPRLDYSHVSRAIWAANDVFLPLVGGRSLESRADLVFTVYDDVQGARPARQVPPGRCWVWKADLGLKATKQHGVEGTTFTCPHAFWHPGRCKHKALWTAFLEFQVDRCYLLPNANLPAPISWKTAASDTTECVTRYH